MPKFVKRQFVEFFKEVLNDFYEIPYNTEVRWLSWEQVSIFAQWKSVVHVDKEKLHSFPELQTEA